MALGLYSMISSMRWQAKAWLLLEANNRSKNNYFIECCMISLQKCFIINIANFFDDTTSEAISVKNYLKILKKGGLSKDDTQIYKAISDLLNNKSVIKELNNLRGDRAAHINTKEFINSLNLNYEGDTNISRGAEELILWAEKIYRIIESHEIGEKLPIEEDLIKLESDYDEIIKF